MNSRSVAFCLPFSIALLAIAWLGIVATAQAPAPVSELPAWPGDAAVGPAGGEQHEPAVARGQDSWLVVWPDHRERFSSLLNAEPARGLYAMRVAESGPLDAVPFPITDLFGEKDEPKVAWNGTDWLVVWQQRTPNQFFYRAEIMAVRVSSSGVVLDPTPISVYRYPFSIDAEFALGSDGNGFLVVSAGTSGGEDTPLSFVIGAGGQVLNPGGTPLPDQSGLQFNYDLAFAGGRYLLVWSQTDVRGLLIDSAGGAVGGIFFISRGFRPRVASDGNEFLVARSYDPSIGPEEISVLRVSPTRVVGAQIRVATGVGSERLEHVDVAFNGSTWVTGFRRADLFGSNAGLRVARISPAGVVLDPEGVPLPATASAVNPAVGAGGASGSVLLVWDDPTTVPVHTGDIFGMTVSSALASGAAMELSTGAPRQAAPEIAAGGAGFLAVFTSESAAGNRIMARRLDRLGRSLDAEPVEIANNATYGSPSVAWNGSVFLIAWHDRNGSSRTDDRVLAARMAADGTVLDPQPLLVMNGLLPSCAAAGGVFLVAASQFSSSQIQFPIAARVDDTGAVLDPSPLVIGTNYSQFVDATAMGNDWVVAWQRHASHDNPRSTVQMAIVRNNGSASPPQLVSGSPTAGGSASATVAASQDRILVAYVDNASLPTDIGAALYDASGVRLRSVSLSGATANQYAPTATWNDREFVVAWQDERNQAAFFDWRTDIYAARVSAAGTLLDPDGYVVTAGAEHEIGPALVGSEGSNLFLAARFHAGPPVAAFRVDAWRQGSWRDLGFGLAGAGGEPVLEAHGAVQIGSTVTLAVTSAAPASPAAFVLGVQQLNLPFLGGTLVPSPDAGVPFATDAAGAASARLPVPVAVATGATFYAQAWILDAGAPAGLAATNAMAHVTP